MICLSILQALFSCYAIFTWIWAYKTHDLTNYQLTVGSFLPAITFMWSDWKIPGWPQFFQQQVFPSVPSLVNFNCSIIFEVSTSISSVLIWPLQALHNVCFFWMFCDHLKNHTNRTGYEMMCSNGIWVEDYLCLILWQIEGLMPSGKDWTLMLHSYLTLLLELLH